MQEEIEDMFRSRDKDLIKLAQKICHKRRISYFLYTDHYIFTYWDVKGQLLKRKKGVDYYSLYDKLENTGGFSLIKPKYKIQL
jgi:hypothetical protein